MGSPDSDPDAQTGELPQHRVRITEAFYLGAHEVTVGQFKRFARETGYETEEEKGKRRSTWRLAIAGQTDNHPVVAVTWNDAKAFCKWLSRKEGRTYRLPTEAEWEYACRAGTTTRWSFGDNGGELGDYAWYDANTNRRRPYPVGQKKPNAWGLHDMHGNVEEWCADWDGLDYYISSPLDDPTGPAAGTRRVARGGSFYFGSLDTRSAWRDRTRPDNCGVNGGFRVTRVISPSPAPR
jgi:formylglycine-generating enzyme required for sulfatase activity